MFSSNKNSDGTDFSISVPSGRFKILQLTDPQITRLETARTEIRRSQIGGAFFSGINNIHDNYIRTYRYIDEAVERTNPDLIVVTGDLVYGETDDSGELFCEFIHHMDGFKIPWTTVFGNHDNESAIGVDRQCELLQASEYCLFNRGNVTGNCNYSVAIESEGKTRWVLFMLDTNGCHYYGNPGTFGEGLMSDNINYDKITQKCGIYDDQIEWYKSTLEAAFAKEKAVIPSLAFFHIPPYISTKTFFERYPNSDGRVPTGNDDFGCVFGLDGGGGIDEIDRDMKFTSLAESLGTTGMFFGHLHINSLSIMHGKTRYTYGLKAGTHNDYLPDSLGATLITLNDESNKPTVEHIYCEYRTTK